MEIEPNLHLTYCTNIHPGETWQEIFEAIRQHVPDVKAGISEKFGIGLRLSGAAAAELVDNKALIGEFNQWLSDNNCYVFTMNGFPYGQFHETVVKEDVHRPDWLDPERVVYTKNLATILASCMGELNEAGISTSPVSYRHWHADNDDTIRRALPHFMEVLLHFHTIYEQTGKVIHLDIEPEPDGTLENSTEFIRFYNEFLLPEGKRFLESCGLNHTDELIRRYIQLCYDVCHFSVEFEEAADVISKLDSENIPVGKIQISAALRSSLPASQTYAQLVKFNESTYLHQAVVRQGSALKKFTDLAPLLDEKPVMDEVRCHFHVPIFTDSYGGLKSTQGDIEEVLRLCKEKKFSNHLEVETYTWQVLPEEHHLELSESIRRELDWVKDQWEEK